MQNWQHVNQIREHIIQIYTFKISFNSDSIRYDTCMQKYIYQMKSKVMSYGCRSCIQICAFFFFFLVVAKSTRFYSLLERSKRISQNRWWARTRAHNNNNLTLSADRENRQNCHKQVYLTIFSLFWWIISLCCVAVLWSYLFTKLTFSANRRLVAVAVLFEKKKKCSVWRGPIRNSVSRIKIRKLRHYLSNFKK